MSIRSASHIHRNKNALVPIGDERAQSVVPPRLSGLITKNPVAMQQD